MNEENTRLDDAGMRMALRGLRRDIDPGVDLWPGIAARIQSLPQQSAQAPRTSRLDRLWPFAMAASLLLAVGVAWHFNPAMSVPSAVPQMAQDLPATRTDTLVQREADSMTVHYQSALLEMERLPTPASWQPGLDALDRSAVEIRLALQHDPNSRLLLERLRATYTRRLVLARRALYA
ncbi:MAG: hypothetical protein M3Q51_03650 [Pseudomonadota bacterium]|nr:hypothetical protein [Pseudomonadota bacterium]MDQ3160100.1 hypothetical protein [Pseudomonadota bacterium]